jgi:hypothetical protein
VADYRAAVGPLCKSIGGVINGPFGDVFSRPTNIALAMDAPAICIDVSAVGEIDKRLQIAILLATWDECFSAVEAAHRLADEGIAPRRTFFLVLDELWRPLRVGEGLVDHMDTITRTNRQQGIGQAYITHSLADLDALPNPEDRAKARGFAERAGFLVTAGLPTGEFAALRKVQDYSEAEAQLVTGWASPPGFGSDPDAGWPGRGKFLVKAGGRPGVPFKLRLYGDEARVHDTNKRWNI